jgi:hypothetical protein
MLRVELLCRLLLHRERHEQRVRSVAARDGLEQVPAGRGKGRALAPPGPRRASLRALRRQGDGAGDDLLVDGLGQSVEHGGLEAVLGDGDVVRADRAAALLVVAPLRCRHAEPA